MKGGNLTIPEHLLSYRRTKSISEHARKPRKSPKKCMYSALDSISEDVTIQTPNSSGELSSISELSEDNPVYNTAELYPAMDPALSPASETASNDLTLLSPMTTMDNESYIIANFNASTESAGAEMVVEHLRRTLTQIVSSSKGDPRLAKLLDSLISVVIQEFYGLPEERDLLRKLVSWRNCILFFSLVLWILALAAVLVSTLSFRSSYHEPPPT